MSGLNRICLFAVVATAGCGDRALDLSDVDGGAPPADLAVLVDFAVVSDLAGAPPADFAMIFDIAVQNDIASSPDIAVNADLTMRPVDIAVPVDIATPPPPPDLTVVRDFTVVVDLTVPPDLLPPPATCKDGIKNGNESDVDCGGSCGKCGGGKRCAANADCVGPLCTAGVCNYTLRFGAALNENVAGSPAALASGDLDGDGAIDLVVVNSSNDFAGVMLGNNNGTFGAVKLSGAGVRPVAVATGDLNGDGVTDVAVANSNGAAVLVGHGDGTLGNPSAWATGPNPTSLLVTDVNGDGRPDILVANRGDVGADFGNVAVLLSSLKGIQPPVAVAMGSYPTAVAVEDFDRDGKRDLVAANLLWNGGVSMKYGDGMGAYPRGPVFFASSGNPYAVATADLDRDGISDVIVANSGTDDIGFLGGNGNGTLRTVVLTPCGKTPSALAVADFNLDGIRDVAVVNSIGMANTLTILLGKGNGTFQPPVVLNVGSGPGSVVTADFDRDGKPDLAVTDYYNSRVSVILNTSF